MRKYLSKLIVFLFPIFSFVLVYELLMAELKETMIIEDVLIEQQTDSSLFMRKYLDQEFNGYKMTGLKVINPEVIVVGSSRVMQFRHEYFNTSFYNAGGLINNHKDLISFLSKKNNSNLTLIGIDPWWFKKDNIDNAISWAEKDDAEIVKGKRRYNAKNKIIDIVKDCVAPRLTKNIGGYAQIYNGGFRLDGSMKIPDNRVSILFENNKFIDTESPPIPRRILEGVTGRFSVSQIDTVAYNKVIHSLYELSRKGEKFVVYLPPFTNESYELFKNSEEQKEFFLFATQFMPQSLSERELPFIPIETPKDYNLSDTYFVDGIHPSEIFVAIQTLKYSKELSKTINNDKLEKMIVERFCNLLFYEKEFKLR